MIETSISKLESKTASSTTRTTEAVVAVSSSAAHSFTERVARATGTWPTVPASWTVKELKQKIVFCNMSSASAPFFPALAPPFFNRGESDETRSSYSESDSPEEWITKIEQFQRKSAQANALFQATLDDLYNTMGELNGPVDLHQANEYFWTVPPYSEMFKKNGIRSRAILFDKRVKKGQKYMEQSLEDRGVLVDAQEAGISMGSEDFGDTFDSLDPVTGGGLKRSVPPNFAAANPSKRPTLAPIEEEPPIEGESKEQLKKELLDSLIRKYSLTSKYELELCELASKKAIVENQGITVPCFLLEPASKIFTEMLMTGGNISSV